MTYCLAIKVKQGIVFCSDSRTNAGVDQISTYSKMHRFGINGERQMVVLTAGNLSTTQAVITQLRNDIKSDAAINLMNVSSIDDAAEYLGQVSRQQQAKYEQSSVHAANFIIGGQINGNPHYLMMVYAQGNHIATSKDTPYLQIGESKYGKPILDRIIEPGLALDTAALCALVSMDSTIRSNLTVGPPVELAIYPTNSLTLDRHYRLELDSDYLRDLKNTWDQRLKEAFSSLPPIQWAALSEKDPDSSDHDNH